MSGVSEELSRPLHRSYSARVIVALAVLAFVAGPGFLTAALLLALYKETSSLPDVHAASKPQQVASRVPVAARVDVPGGLLSPVSERLSPGFEHVDPSAAGRPASDNPMKAYLDLRGSSQYTTLPVDRAQALPRSYRTVCVRLCDGSYFPISEHATSDEFAADEAQCRSQCGSPARLFVYEKARETPLQMRDLSGNAYLELPTAFLFHTSYDSQCTCHSRPWTVASRQRHGRYAELKASRQVAVRESVTAAAELTESKNGRASSTVSQLPSLRETAPLQIAASDWNGPVATIKARSATPLETATIVTERRTSERIALVSARAELLGSIELPRQPPQQRVARPPKASIRKAASQLKLATVEPFALGGPTASGSVTVADISADERPAPRLTAADIVMRNINPQY